MPANATSRIVFKPSHRLAPKLHFALKVLKDVPKLCGKGAFIAKPSFVYKLGKSNT